MSHYETRKASGSPQKSVGSSNPSSIDDDFLTAPQTPEESVSGDRISRPHSSCSSGSYVSVDEHSGRVIRRPFQTKQSDEPGEKWGQQGGQETPVSRPDMNYNQELVSEIISKVMNVCRQRSFD